MWMQASCQCCKWLWCKTQSHLLNANNTYLHLPHICLSFSLCGLEATGQWVGMQQIIFISLSHFMWLTLFLLSAAAMAAKGEPAESFIEFQRVNYAGPAEKEHTIFLDSAEVGYSLQPLNHCFVIVWISWLHAVGYINFSLWYHGSCCHEDMLFEYIFCSSHNVRKRS